MLDTLTKVQKEVFQDVVKHISKNGLSPTLTEIAESLGYNAKSGVEKQINNLVKKGYLHKSPKKWRGIKITNLGKIYIKDEIERMASLKVQD